MKRLPLILFALFASNFVFGQYWQQQTDYAVNVTLNDKEHTLKGDIRIEYTNNSPDKLDYIWFHLWPNAYKDNKTAFAKQILRDKDGKSRLKAIKDKGYIEGLEFTVDGSKAVTEADPENIDVIKVVLPKALASGQKIVIQTPFTVHIPTYSSRSGHLDQSYIICQWYPKPAVYDRKGWHQFPYLDQGEFYSEFGSFAVNITVPAGYVVGATGELQNADELATYKSIGTNNNDSTKVIRHYSASGNAATKTLAYKAANVHDFAWFADKDFVIRYDTARLSETNTIDVFTYGYETGTESWKRSVSFVEDAVRHYSNWLGEYPWPVAQAVEGPKNVMSGGMEYPMITLITSPGADDAKMDAVITHEVGHNWFYGILASNERQHAWMDEGLNTYFQFRYEAEKYRANSIFGDAIPAELKTVPVEQFMNSIYGAMLALPMEEAIETPSPDFTSKDGYALVEYIKTATWVYIMENVLGKETVDQAFKTYYAEWKFKHPYPEDFKVHLEKAAGQNIDQLWALLNKKGKFD